MKKARLEKIDSHLARELRNDKFRKVYEVERVKVSLAQKIAELREKGNLRQVDLAKKLGVTQQFVSQIETGQENNLTIETLLKIARSLGRNVKISFPKSTTQEPRVKIA